MFPIVPYYLNMNFAPRSNMASVSDFTGSNKLLVAGRITTSCRLETGATSAEIDPGNFEGDIDSIQMSVNKNNYGHIDLDKTCKLFWKTDSHWIRAIRLSDDCHSCNVQLKQMVNQKDKSKFILEVIRPVEVGQELLLWFSEDVLALMQMVFLTPSNIQGQKKYVCTRCSALYESPNPLKIHLTLSCSRRKISTLWQRLNTDSFQRSLPNSPCNSNTPSPTKFTFELSKIPSTTPPLKSAIDLTTTNDKKILYKPYHASHQSSSAFTPFPKRKTPIDNNTTDIHYQTTHTSNLLTQEMTLLPTWQQQSQLLLRVPSAMDLNLSRQDSQQASATMDEEAHIETIVSSLGRSKQGHICLYCGKCYSRKYGLKIHIRTHTGYKPLKCKYCLRPFGDPSNLNKHVRLHAEGDTPYKCELCGKVLVRRRDLERHIKSRHMVDIEDDNCSNEEQEEQISIDN